MDIPNHDKIIVTFSAAQLKYLKKNNIERFNIIETIIYAFLWEWYLAMPIEAKKVMNVLANSSNA